jgi:hypothetical protein
MLILADAEDLDQSDEFRQWVLQPAGNGNGAAQGHVRNWETPPRASLDAE